MDIIANILQLHAIFNGNVPPTPINTYVDRSMKWSQFTYLPHPLTTQYTGIPIITNQDRCLFFKYQLQFCYNMDGFFILPK